MSFNLAEIMRATLGNAAVFLLIGACSSRPTSPHRAIHRDPIQETISHSVTFYGGFDKEPPGASIAYPIAHATAGGTGTYEDPLTMATAPSEWQPGTRMYVPFIRKYVIMEDHCDACALEWKEHGNHRIAIWMPSDAAHAAEAYACAEALTRTAADVEVEPPDDRPVSAAPLFDTSTGRCSADPDPGVRSQGITSTVRTASDRPAAPSRAEGAQCSVGIASWIAVLMLSFATQRRK